MTQNKQASPSPARAKSPRRARTTAPEVPVVSLPEGKFVRSIDVVTHTSQNLVVTLGETEKGETVLVPYIEFACQRAAGIADNVPQEPLFGTISAENSAFLIQDLCQDFSRITYEIAMLCSERSGLEPDRADYMLRCLVRAAEAIDSSRSHIEIVRNYALAKKERSEQ